MIMVIWTQFDCMVKLKRQKQMGEFIQNIHVPPTMATMIECQEYEAFCLVVVSSTLLYLT